jgi:hypothetical protein
MCVGVCSIENWLEGHFQQLQKGNFFVSIGKLIKKLFVGYQLVT